MRSVAGSLTLSWSGSSETSDSLGGVQSATNGSVTRAVATASAASSTAT